MTTKRQRHDAQLPDVRARARRLIHYGLALLLLATMAKNLFYALIVPPLVLPDERYHFEYAQAIERYGSVKLAPRNYASEEVDLLWKVVFRDRELLKSEWSREQRREIVKRLDVARSQSSSNVYTRSSLGPAFRIFSGQHPPLYHALVGSVQWLLEGKGITVRVLASRLVSLLFGLCTILFAYRLVLEIWPERPGLALLVATLTSYQRLFTRFTSSVSNLSLEAALFSLFLLLCVNILHRGIDWRRGLALGASLALGLLTRVSFLSAVPLAVLIFVWSLYRLIVAHGRKRDLWPWVLVLAVPIIGASWWYRGVVLSGGESLIGLYGEVRTAATSTLFGFITSQAWLERWWSLLAGYWSWSSAPTLGGAVLGWTSVATTLAALGWVIRRLARRKSVAGEHTVLAVAFMGLATLSMDAFQVYVEYRYRSDLGGMWLTRSAYYLTPIAAQMTWYALGLVQLVSRRRATWNWLVSAGMVAFYIVSFLRDVIPQYYGEGLLRAFGRAALLQPVSYPLLLAIMGAFLFLSCAVLVALWRAPDRVAADLAS